MPECENDSGDAGPVEEKPPPRTGGVGYELSLELLRDLLREWHDHWDMVNAEMQRLPHSTKMDLQRLPTDPGDGLRAARRMFAESFHPEVVAFFCGHLAAAEGTLDQLIWEDRNRPSETAAAVPDLESRVHRLEAVLAGVGAVLGVLGPDRPADP